MQVKDRGSDDSIDVKRRKLDTPPDTSSTLWHTDPGPSSSVSPQRTYSSPASCSLSPPLIYHMALRAHQSSHSHLQQVFIPPDIKIDADYVPVPSFVPDHLAAQKSFALLLFALDLLHIGLSTNILSDQEKVAFSLEFAIVSIKVVSTWHGAKMDLKLAFRRFRDDDLLENAANYVESSLHVARQQKYLRSQSLKLELLSIHLIFLQRRGNVARRSIREALARCPLDLSSHRYALVLLQLEHDTTASVAETLILLDQLDADVRHRNLDELLRLVQITRLRFLFTKRRWDLVPAALDACGQAMEAPCRSDTWNDHSKLHYLLFMAMWKGRTGDDDSVKKMLKRIYPIIDKLSHPAAPKEVRENGAVFSFDVAPANAPPQSLQLQSTPLNVLYLLTYLVTVVIRKDFLGTNQSCKSLILPMTMESYGDHARSADMWDSAFSLAHGPADANRLTATIYRIRAEVLLEHATALMFRSDRDGAQQSLDKAVDHSHRADSFSELAPQILLVRGQFLHLFGKDAQAMGHYMASRTLLRSATELGLIVQICETACSGKLSNLPSHPGLREELELLVEKCRASSNANLKACGLFLGSIWDSNNRVASKKKLSSAYEIAQKANNNILRCLIFAFTTSVHFYGPAERTLRQLETGRDLAHLMGGKDRADGVGQLALGLWFAQKLKVYHRREGDAKGYEQAKLDQARHQRRLEELSGSS